MERPTSRPRASAHGSSSLTSQPGDQGLLYDGIIGQTMPADALDARDRLADRKRFDSEGDWAFCRFSSEVIPAVRFGFQHGSFEIGATARTPDPDLLQLHLEVMTGDGGMLWVPTGRFPGSIVESSQATKDVAIVHEGITILHIGGWPHMSWSMRSDDGELEVHLQLDVGSVTLLPDCLLPHAIFSMWETLGTARGSVRVGSHTESVEGHAFYDHVRVLHGPNAVAPRRMYLYTTLALEDGGGLFGYYALDAAGQPIDYYCFGVYIDATGAGTFLADGRTEDLRFDADDLPSYWRLDWRADGLAIEATIDVADLPLKRGWGGPMWPRTRRDYSVVPLVLNATVRISRGGTVEQQNGRGLTEYYDAERWQG